MCGSKTQRVHSQEERTIRDLNICSKHVWINCSYRKIVRMSCNRIVVEDLEFFEPYSRATRRLALFIHELCKVLTVQDGAKHFGINWKTVKAIDKYFQEQQYSKTDYMVFVYSQLTR